jgi:hypothetical protein
MIWSPGQIFCHGFSNTATCGYGTLTSLSVTSTLGWQQLYRRPSLSYGRRYVETVATLPDFLNHCSSGLQYSQAESLAIVRTVTTLHRPLYAGVDAHVHYRHTYTPLFAPNSSLNYLANRRPFVSRHKESILYTTSRCQSFVGKMTRYRCNRCKGDTNPSSGPAH